MFWKKAFSRRGGSWRQTAINRCRRSQSVDREDIKLCSSFCGRQIIYWFFNATFHWKLVEDGTWVIINSVCHLKRCKARARFLVQVSEGRAWKHEPGSHSDVGIENLKQINQRDFPKASLTNWFGFCFTVAQVPLIVNTKKKSGISSSS